MREVVADARYGIIANYSFLRHAGVAAFILPRQHMLGLGGAWGKGRFRYLE